LSRSTVSNNRNGHARRAVFLDRDGTINVEKNYLHKVEDFEFIPGSPEAIKRLKDAGFIVIVVSNQSGIARGYFDEQALETLHRHVQEELAEHGTSIDAFYFCPHHPEQGLGAYKVVCECRKGAPGMLLQAAREHGIDLEQSFMVGDKLADIEAGRRAGCRSVLVLTGYGESVAQKQKMATVEKCQNLSVAVDLILKKYVVNRGVTD
jgi:D-glycero-D-manno-heptose 1,7-bisphosphate phosphatase